jgi:hypothetical protein
MVPLLDELSKFIFQKSGLKPPTSVGKDPTVRHRRSKPLNPSTLVGGGSIQLETDFFFAIFEQNPECTTGVIR